MALRLFRKKRKRTTKYDHYNDPRIHKMVDRNNNGIAREKAGNTQAAIRLYEANIRDHFDGTHPYNRLRIIYTRQKRYADAVRICQAYLALAIPDRPNSQKGQAHFQHHLAKLQAKAAKQ